jgi:predicted small secreted protein
MKRTFKVLGIIALLAIIGFSMAACGTTGGGEPTKFEGRWVNEYAISIGYTDSSFTFTGNNFIRRSVNQQGSATRSGTFTFTDTAITFTPKAGENWTKFTQGYTLAGNTLRLAQVSEGLGYGEFIKQ